MTRFAVLPSIPLDPQNEADLVTAAIQRVYSASNGRLNDFSSASALRAILEGQVFAQGELLKYLNSLPEAFVIEWLATVLGIQRKIGSPSTVGLQINLTRPLPTTFVLPKGFIVRTSFGIGTDVSFTTNEELIIFPGQISGDIEATSTEIGSDQNVPADTVTQFDEALAFLRSVTNPSPSIGGEDAESLTEVRQRAYSLMTRRLPVTSDDWRGFFQDLLGLDLVVKTTTTGTLDLNFWFLDSNGEKLSSSTLQTLLKKAEANVQTPVQVYVENINIQEIDLRAVVQATPTNALAQQIRDFFASALIPNRNFSIDDIIQVQDISSLFSRNYGLINPNLDELEAFSDPLGTDPEFGKRWVNTGTYLENELIVTQDNEFYRVEVPFSPQGGLVPNNYDSLIFQRARVYQSGTLYRADDIIVDPEIFGAYYVTNDFLSGASFLEDITTPGSKLRPLRINVPDLSSNPKLWYGRVVTDGTVVKLFTNSSFTPENFTTTQNPGDFAEINSIKALVPWTYTLGQNFPQGSIIFPNFQNFTSFATSFDEEVLQQSIFDAQFQFYVAAQSTTISDTSTVSIALGLGYISLVPIIFTFERNTSYQFGDYLTAGGKYYYVLNDFTSGGSLEGETNVELVNIFQTRNNRLLLNRYEPRFLRTEYVSSGNRVYQALQSFTPKEETIESLIRTSKLVPTPYNLTEENGALGQILPLGEITIQRPQGVVSLDVGFESNDVILQIKFVNGDVQSFSILSGGSSSYSIGQQIKSQLSVTIGSVTYFFNKQFTFYVTSTNSGQITGLSPGLNILARLIREEHVLPTFSETGSGATIRVEAIEQQDTTKYLVRFREIVDHGDGYKLDNFLSASIYGGVLPFEIIEILPNTFPLASRPLREIRVNQPFLIGLEEYVSTKEFSPAPIGLEIYKNLKELRKTGTIYGKKPDHLLQLQNFQPIPLEINPSTQSYFGTGIRPERAFDTSSSSIWRSNLNGSSNLETSFVAIDFSRPVAIDGLEIRQSISVNSRGGFKLQASNFNEAWSTIIDSSNTNQIQAYRFRPVYARYWRVVNANIAPSPLSEWKIENIKFTFKELQNPVINLNQYEDLVRDGNSLYRVMRSFTPVPGESPREAEIRGDLLKIVQKYSGSDVIHEVKANSVLSLGRCEISFNPQDTYVFEKARFGERASQGKVTDYGNGTILL
jgi:hypothetical protein